MTDQKERPHHWQGHKNETSRPNNITFAAIGRKLYDFGYSVIPCLPGGKKPGFTGWQKVTIDARQVDAWAANGRGSWNVSVRTGEGILATDIDVYDSEVSDRIRANFMARFGQAPTRIGRAPKALLVYACDEAFRKITSPCWRSPDGQVHKVEILGKGQHFLAYGIHPDTGRPYEWIDGPDLRELAAIDLPLVTSAEVAAWITEELPKLIPADWERLDQGSRGEGGRNPLIHYPEPLDIGEERIQNTLAALDPDMDHDSWVRVGMALHHQFEGGSAGFDLWDDWSRRGSKYDARVIRSKWQSFDILPDGRSPVTFASVIKLARDKNRDARRELNRVIGEGGAFDPMPEVLSVEEMLARFVLLTDGSRVFDIRFPQHIISLPDFRNATAASFTEIETGEFFAKSGKPKTRRIPHAATWVTNANRQTAVGVTFKAGAGLYVQDPLGRQCVNLWNGYRRSSATGTGDPTTFVDHVRWLFKDRAEHFLDWLAHIEQFPGVLPHTAWLHISTYTGTGRNWISSVLARVFAGYAASSVDLVHIMDSGFNERLSRKVIAIVDEIREGGPGQWKHAETMKQMITCTERNINVKFGRQSVEFNACRFLLFSNHRQAIPIDDSDRRIEVVISDEPPRNADYYSRLYQALDDVEFIAAVAAYLGGRDLSGFNPGAHAIKGVDKEQVIDASRGDELRNLIEFSEQYPLELVTSIRLEHAAGIYAFGKAATRFAHLAKDAGWEPLGRHQVGGKRNRLYVRREHVSKWREAESGFEGQLPQGDGGNVEWKDPDDALV